MRHFNYVILTWVGPNNNNDIIISYSSGMFIGNHNTKNDILISFSYLSTVSVVKFFSSLKLKYICRNLLSLRQCVSVWNDEHEWQEWLLNMLLWMYLLLWMYSSGSSFYHVRSRQTYSNWTVVIVLDCVDNYDRSYINFILTGMTMYYKLHYFD